MLLLATGMKCCSLRRHNQMRFWPHSLQHVCVHAPVCGQENKIAEGQQQWWQFKASHFDSVLLFKMGKFYEASVRMGLGRGWEAGGRCEQAAAYGCIS